MLQAQADITALQAEIQALKDLLAGITRSSNNLYFDGMNVHIRSGNGSTNADVNSFGNLIVGYNELRATGDDRTGSHNIVVGKYQDYSSYGGIVAGFFNTVSGNYSSVTGGENNIASGDYSSISGGRLNEASAYSSSVSGGQNNGAIRAYSQVAAANGATTDADYDFEAQGVE